MEILLNDNDTDKGLHVIDISNITSPSFKGFINTNGKSRNVFVKEKYAYVSDFSNGMLIIDLLSNVTKLNGLK